MKKRLFLLVLAALLLLSGCASGQSSAAQQEDDSLHILATTWPVYCFAQAVTEGAENISLDLLVQDKLTCVHDYTLTVNDMKRIEAARMRIRQYECLATSVTQSLNPDKVSSSGNHSKTEDAVVAIVDLRAKIADEVRTMTERYQAASEMIARLPDERERLVLEMKYLGWHAESWNRVMEYLHLERSQSFAVHLSALEHIADMLEGE